MELPKTWLLLLYRLPAKKSSERVNLWRKLKKFGAVQLKNSAYVLPDAPVHFERFQWLAKQVRDSGGDSTLIRVTEVEGLTGEQIAELFRQERAQDYAQLNKDIVAATKRKNVDGDTIESFRQRFQEIRDIDFFDCPTAHEVEMALRRLDRGATGKPTRGAKLDQRKFTGRTWLTRPRPEIDRVGSAWLIRRFIDAKARFIFASDSKKFPDAIPYDMVDVEFTHHGQDCTFETLVERFGIQDKALLAIAEMVHDTDLEDGKFQRPECIGIDRVLKGWARLGLSDEQLLEKGGECFDALYEHLRKER
jgi:hypothetical protein